MASQEPPAVEFERDEHYGILAMDGLYCHVGDHITRLIFFQEITSPPPKAISYSSSPEEDKTHVYYDKIQRKLQFEIRMPTENLIELVENVALHHAALLGGDVAAAKLGLEQPEIERDFWVETPERDVSSHKRTVVGLKLSKREFWKIYEEANPEKSGNEKTSKTEKDGNDHA